MLVVVNPGDRGPPLRLVLDTDRVRDAVDVVEVADHLDRIVNRRVVPAVRPKRVRVRRPTEDGVSVSLTA